MFTDLFFNSGSQKKTPQIFVGLDLERMVVSRERDYKIKNRNNL